MNTNINSKEIIDQKNILNKNETIFNDQISHIVNELMGMGLVSDIEEAKKLAEEWVKDIKTELN